MSVESYQKMVKCGKCGNEADVREYAVTDEAGTGYLHIPLCNNCAPVSLEDTVSRLPAGPERILQGVGGGPLVRCRNCGREIYPYFDRGTTTWTHKFSGSQPTKCQAEPPELLKIMVQSR